MSDETCRWIDWRNGPYQECGQGAVIQIRGVWLCQAHYERHMRHIEREERCWCLVI